MSVEDFKEKLKEDPKLLPDIEFLQKQINDEPVLNKLYDLCRMTYITQFEADIFKNEDGKFDFYISNVDFKEFGNNIKDYIIKLNEKDKQKIFVQKIVILKKYYRSTATSEETKFRTHLEKDVSNQLVGSVGTIYDFNRIKWKVFVKGLQENIKLN